MEIMAVPVPLSLLKPHKALEAAHLVPVFMMHLDEDLLTKARTSITMLNKAVKLVQATT